MNTPYEFGFEIGLLGNPAAEKLAATAKRPGLWANIRAKKKRGEATASPGDKDYPDAKNWKKVTAISEKTSASARDLALLGLPILAGGLGAAWGSRMGENKWIHNGENPSDPNGFDARFFGAVGGGLGGAGLGLIPALIDKYETRDGKIQPRQAYLKRWKGHTGLDHLIEDAPVADANKTAASSPAWQRSEGKNPDGGLNAKGRASLKAQGKDIKRPQPEGGARRDSFCARMGGMKAKLTSAATANDPESRINKALRKWNC